MHRRKLLKFAALGAAGILVSSGAFVFFEKFDYLARKIVMKDTAMLNIDSTVYDQFFSDVEKQRKWDKLFDKQHKHLLKWHYYIDNKQVYFVSQAIPGCGPIIMSTSLSRSFPLSVVGWLLPKPSDAAQICETWAFVACASRTSLSP